MLGKSPDVTGRRRKIIDRDDPVDLQALRTLRRLISAATTTTKLLDVRDKETKQELLDCFVLAEISVLRLAADEAKRSSEE